MVDIPSKFIFVHPQRDKDAITTACSLLQFIKNYGIPREIRSDNGPEFVNKVWDAFITLLRIERYTTAPYRSQAHGTVENANRQVITLLRSTLFVLGSETKKWHEHLPIVQFLLNRVIHEDTGLSSNDWVFGLRGPHMNKTVTQIDSVPIDFEQFKPSNKRLRNIFSLPIKEIDSQFTSNFYQITLEETFPKSLNFIRNLQEYKVSIIPICFEPKGLLLNQNYQTANQSGTRNKNKLNIRFIINVPTR